MWDTTIFRYNGVEYVAEDWGYDKLKTEYVKRGDITAKGVHPLGTQLHKI